MSLFKAAALIGVVTIGSKLLGAVRDWKIATVYGTHLLSDAYLAGFQLPSFSLILLGGLGGPFHTATVAILTAGLKDGKPTPELRKLVHYLLGLSAAIFGLLAIVVWFWSDTICHLLLQHGSFELITLTAQQLRWMSPIIVLGPLVGIACGLSNLSQRYFWPSFAPAGLSLLLIMGLTLYPLDRSGFVLAMTTVLGALVQLLVQVPDLCRLGWLRFGVEDRQTSALALRTSLKRYGAMLFPATMGTTIGQLNVYVDMFFTATLPSGGWTSIVLANRLIQLPIGVLQSALLVPIFPRFTQQVGEGNLHELRHTFRLGVTSLWVLSLPLLVVIVCHGEWLIQCLFQHGQFTARSTHLVFQALLGLSLSMVAYFARDTITRIFYAFQDTKTPVWVSVISLGTNALLDGCLVGPLGVAGITLSTTIVSVINMILLTILINKHLDGLGWRALLTDLGWLLLGAAGSLAINVLILKNLVLDSWLTHSLSVLLGLGLYVSILCYLPVPAVQQLLKRLYSQIRVAQ